MKKSYIAGLILAGLLVGCGGGGSSTSDEGSETSSQETQEQGENRNSNEQMETEGNGGTGAGAPNTPTTPPMNNAKTFTANVMPILENKCKNCHGSKGNFTVTTPSATYANISDLKASVTEAGQYLIGKSSNSIGHGGGEVISTGSVAYQTIQSWIASGADFN